MKEVFTVAAVLALTALPAAADVTSQQSIVIDAVGIVKMHGTTTSMTTSDKERHDTEFHCEGFVSMICGNVRSGDIVRLDKDLSWQLRPDKKIYTETPFPTPEERAQAQQKLQETMDKMKQCQQKQASRKPDADKGDTSDCEMSPPKVEVNQTDEHASIAGHESKKATVKLSQTCTNKKTGDVCEFVYGFDTWLTQDSPEGLADQRAFTKAYMTKMGLDANAQNYKGLMQQFLAPYAGQMKDLADKASALKGYPMRTTFRLIVGGPKCSKGKQSSDSSDSSPSVGGGLSGLAANAGGKLIGGLFAKKNKDSGSDSTSAAAAANSAPTLPDGYAQVIAFTSETTAITVAPIASEQFEIPAGWTLEKPKPSKASEYTCPTDDK